MKARRHLLVTVSVSDGKDINGNPDTSTDATIPVTINVTNVDEAPVVSGDTAVDFYENATGTVASYTAEDPERHSYSWTFRAPTLAISTS